MELAKEITQVQKYIKELYNVDQDIEKIGVNSAVALKEGKIYTSIIIDTEKKMLMLATYERLSLLNLQEMVRVVNNMNNDITASDGYFSLIHENYDKMTYTTKAVFAYKATTRIFGGITKEELKDIVDESRRWYKVGKKYLYNESCLGDYKLLIPKD